MRLRDIFVLLAFIMCATSAYGRGKSKDALLRNVYKQSRSWVDSVYLSMSDEERIAQLFWIAVESPHIKQNFQRVRDELIKYQPGGIILYRMSLNDARSTVSEFQGESKIPLFVSIDGEFGAAMRIDSVIRFPRAITLGAIQDDTLIYQLGREMARQFRLIGIQVNLAPVADVNYIQGRQAIGNRSFGSDPNNVSRKVVALTRGLQDGGVMAVAKHFPGHGNSTGDSHVRLPIVEYDRDSINFIDLPPFKAFIDAGGTSIMTAHVDVICIDSGIPASFSKKAIHQLLRQDLNFKGLVLIDAINMSGAASMGVPGERDVLALMAGNDVVKYTSNLPLAIQEVGKAIKNGRLSWDEIKSKCCRSLALKYWLTQMCQVVPSNTMCTLSKDLNDSSAFVLNQKLYDSSVTLIQDDGRDVISDFQERSNCYGCLIIGDAPEVEEGLRLKGIAVRKVPLVDDELIPQLIDQMRNFDGFILIVASPNWGRLEANKKRMALLSQFLENKESLMIFLGNPYQLKIWHEISRSCQILIGYENCKESQTAVLGILNGKFKPHGVLPISLDQLK